MTRLPAEEAETFLDASLAFLGRKLAVLVELGAQVWLALGTGTTGAGGLVRGVRGALRSVGRGVTIVGLGRGRRRCDGGLGGGGLRGVRGALVGVRRGVRGVVLVARMVAVFGLALPIAGIELPRYALHLGELSRFTIARDLVLETTGEPIVEGEPESVIAPVDLRAEPVELRNVVRDTFAVVHAELD